MIRSSLWPGFQVWFPGYPGNMDLFPIRSSLKSQGSAPALHPMLVCTATSKREVLPPEITNRAPGSWFFKGWAGALDQGVTWGNSGYPTGKQTGRESKHNIPFHSPLGFFFYLPWMNLIKVSENKNGPSLLFTSACLYLKCHISVLQGSEHGCNCCSVNVYEKYILCEQILRQHDSLTVHCLFSKWYDPIH